jgi:NAD(P)-dependent dehydrogenase (short-subunit alcohol dehydrogenase family)
MKHELRHMREQGSGAIVNCSSIGGLIGLPGRAAYHATKHGVIGLTKSAALEYASRGIRINAVCPGTIDTLMVSEMLAKEPDAMKEIMRDQQIGQVGRPMMERAAASALCSPASLGRSLRASLDGYGLRLAAGTHEEPRASTAPRSRMSNQPPRVSPGHLATVGSSPAGYSTGRTPLGF